MDKITNARLKYICPISTDQFRKNGKNFHCQQCDNTVVDFRNSTKSDLDCSLSQAEGSICGIFKKSQLNTQFRKIAATAFISASALAALSCEPEQQIVPSDHQNHFEEEEVEEEDVLLGVIFNDPTPKLNGGWRQLFLQLEKELVVTESMTKGRVFVQFNVTAEGKAEDFKVIKGLSPDADNEALRVLEKTELKFIPGEQFGQPVKTRMIIPIRFN